MEIHIGLYKNRNDNNKMKKRESSPFEPTSENLSGYRILHIKSLYALDTFFLCCEIDLRLHRQTSVHTLITPRWRKVYLLTCCEHSDKNEYLYQQRRNYHWLQMRTTFLRENMFFSLSVAIKYSLCIDMGHFFYCRHRLLTMICITFYLQTRHIPLYLQTCTPVQGQTQASSLDCGQDYYFFKRVGGFVWEVQRSIPQAGSRTQTRATVPKSHSMVVPGHSSNKLQQFQTIAMPSQSFMQSQVRDFTRPTRAQSQS